MTTLRQLPFMIVSQLLFASAVDAAATGLPVAEPEKHGMSSERLGRINTVFGQYVEDGLLPGVLTAVARNGEVVHFSTAGHADIRAKQPLRPDSIFRLTSMSKPVTVVAALMLFEEGRFLLTDPVARYLPEFADLRVLTGGTVDTPRTRSARTPLLILHLMKQTDGLIYGDENGDTLARMYADEDLASASDLDSFSRAIAALPLQSDPGSEWQYGMGVDVLSRLIEVVAGLPFDQFVAQRIFEPLGMVDTGFFVPDDKLERFPASYRYDAERGMRRSESARRSAYRRPDITPLGGQGLLSTAADYLRFAQMLVNGGVLDGHRLLAPLTVDLMLRDHLGPDVGARALDERWLGMTENRTGDTRLGLGYGLGGYVLMDVAANGVPGSPGIYGWGGNQNTYFWIDRATGIIGLLLTQLTPSGTYPLRAQLRQLTYQALLE